METNSEKAIEALRGMADADFEKPVNSPWYIFPADLVRDELVRRLKLRNDISLEAKKVRYKEIIDRYRVVRNVASLARDAEQVTETDKDLSDALRRAMESRKALDSDMKEHYRQLREIHSQHHDPFEGKAKPGDWRFDGTELCPVCGGIGKGIDNRMCGKCNGRGFISL